MNKYQQGGTVIYDVDTGRGVPDVTYVPTLDLPELKTSPLTSALDTYTKIKEEEQKTAKGNLDSMMKVYDEVTKMRYDNQPQKAVIDEARQVSGLTDDAFNISAEQLKNPYLTAPLSRAASDFANYPGIRDILREQVAFDAKFAEFLKNPPKDPNLAKMALADIEKYKRGEMKGYEFEPSQYTYVDIGKEIGARVKDIPFTEISDVIETDTIVYEQTIRKKSEDAINAVIADLLKTPMFKNNMIARGYMLADNTLTPEGEAMIKDYANALTEERVQVAGLKTKPQGRGGGGAKYGNDPTPATTAGLEGADASIYNGYYNIANSYGLPLDDPANVSLQMSVLTEIQNSKKDTKDTTSEGALSKVNKALRKAAILRGDGIAAIYDAAVEAGYFGSKLDLEGLIGQFEWASVKDGKMAPLAVVQALTDIVGPGNEEQAWNMARNRYRGGQSAVPPAGGTGTSAQPTAPSTTKWTLSGTLAGVDPFQGGTGPVAGTGAVQGMDTYLGYLSGREGSTQNPGSSAVGEGQFIDSTWLDIIKDYPEVKGMSDQQKLDIRKSNNPQDQAIVRRALIDFTEKNAKKLTENGLTSDFLSLYMMHHFGPSGGINILTADPRTPIRNVVSQKVLEANPYITDPKNRIKTVQDLMDYHAPKFGMVTKNSFKPTKWYSKWSDVADEKDATVGRVSKAALELADAASSALGRKLTINSSYRDVEGNAAAGGSSGSKHMEGSAMDISIKNLSSADKKKLLQFLVQSGVKGIGFYNNHLHFDLRDSNKIVTWGTTPSWAKGVV